MGSSITHLTALEIDENRQSREAMLKAFSKTFTGNVALTANYGARPKIKDVIFNPPATIVFWSDNTKTVVKCQEGDEWDAEKGLAMAVAKKYFGNKGNYNNEFNKWLCSDGLTAEGLKDIFVRMADVLNGVMWVKF